jgi:hypothetical protein
VGPSADPTAGSYCRRPRSWRSPPPSRPAGTTAHQEGPRQRRPGGPPATAAGCRPGPADALGQVGQAIGQPGQYACGQRRAGQYDTGTRPPGGLENLAYGLVPVNVRTPRASRIPSIQPELVGLSVERWTPRRGCPALLVRCDADWTAVALGRPLPGPAWRPSARSRYCSHESTSR